MANEPWDLPYSDEGREALRELAKTYEAEGKLRELGLTLTHLARVIKWKGNGDAGDAWAESARVGLKAVWALRQTDDRLALANALRIAAQPWISGLDQGALLDEAEAISREIGDFAGQGWALYAKSKSLKGEAEKECVELATECFEKGGDSVGLACILQTRGISTREIQDFERACDYFLEGGQAHQAWRALYMGAHFAQDSLSPSQLDAIHHRAIEMAQSIGKEDHLTALSGLAGSLKMQRRMDELKQVRKQIRNLKKS